MRKKDWNDIDIELEKRRGGASSRHFPGYTVGEVRQCMNEKGFKIPMEAKAYIGTFPVGEGYVLNESEDLTFVEGRKRLNSYLRRFAPEGEMGMEIILSLLTGRVLGDFDLIRDYMSFLLGEEGVFKEEDKRKLQAQMLRTPWRGYFERIPASLEEAEDVLEHLPRVASAKLVPFKEFEETLREEGQKLQRLVELCGAGLTSPAVEK